MKMACLAIALLASFNAVAAEPVSFPAKAKVSVDANGKLVAVDVLTELPPPVEAFIKKQIASWTFSPPKRGDVTGAGVTYVYMNACALPIDGDDYRLALDFKGNGPSMTRLRGISYPRRDERTGRKAIVLAHVIVEPDGHATVESLEYLSGRNQGPQSFDAAVRDWIATLQFAPEWLGDRPVATQAEIRVNFGGPDRKQALLEASKIPESRECRLAASGESEIDQVAVDSPIHIKPSG